MRTRLLLYSVCAVPLVMLFIWHCTVAFLHADNTYFDDLYGRLMCIKLPGLSICEWYNRLWSSAGLKMPVDAHFFRGGDLVGRIDLVCDLWSGFISRSVHARLQVPVCSSYDLCDPGWHRDTQTDRHFDQLVWMARPAEVETDQKPPVFWAGLLSSSFIVWLLVWTLYRSFLLSRNKITKPTYASFGTVPNCALGNGC